MSTVAICNLRVYEGAHLAHPKVEAHRARGFAIEGEAMPLQADGELLGETRLDLGSSPRRSESCLRPRLRLAFSLQA